MPSSMETRLADALHEVPIGRGSFDVVCDLFHDVPRAVDCDRRVQYECIRVGESMEVFEKVGFPCFGVWIPDLLRCADCERETLPEPTDGYAEALVELDIGWDRDQRVLDASELEILDYSPVDTGQEPPPVPASLLEAIVQRGDPGMLRRSRVSRAIPHFRTHGDEELARLLELGLA